MTALANRKGKPIPADYNEQKAKEHYNRLKCIMGVSTMYQEWQRLLAAYHSCRDIHERAAIVKRIADLKQKMGIR